MTELSWSYPHDKATFKGFKCPSICMKYHKYLPTKLTQTTHVRMPRSYVSRLIMSKEMGSPQFLGTEWITNEGCIMEGWGRVGTFLITKPRYLGLV